MGTHIHVHSIGVKQDFVYLDVREVADTFLTTTVFRLRCVLHRKSFPLLTFASLLCVFLFVTSPDSILLDRSKILACPGAD